MTGMFEAAEYENARYRRGRSRTDGRKAMRSAEDNQD